MADVYNNENSNTSPSSSRDRDHRPSDEMSLFLHQILRSSSSSSASYMAHADPHKQLLTQRDYINRPCQPQEGISVVDLADGTNVAGGGCYLSGHVKGSSAANLSSSSIGGVSENETDECDAESEDGMEALVDEEPPKAAPPRRSSKRSRAAEVHNLSEKRRRSRINEKMKALQELIPNSNKTDKASMLDKVIEYLKELQLQVQMLSLRNGISLYPTSLPGLLQPIQLSRLGFGEENESWHPSVAGLLSLNQESLPQAISGLRKQSSVSNRQGLPDMSNVINLETTFSLESSFQGHFGPFPLHASSQEICRKDVLQHQRQIANHSERDPESGARASVSLPFEIKVPNMEDSSFLESGMIGRDQTGGLLTEDLEHNLMPSQDSKG